MLSELRELGNAGVSTSNFITCEDAEEAILSELGSSSIGHSIRSDEDSTNQGSTTERKDPQRTRERCRQAARRLAARGDIFITQGGKTVDPSFAKGVMELRLTA